MTRDPWQNDPDRTTRRETPAPFACRFHLEAKLYGQPLSGTTRCAKCGALIRPR